MNAEVIAVGSELVSGQKLDTNSQWLSRRLGELGIEVRYHTALADDLAQNIEAFRIAAGRADLVVVGGGLGPTQDDLTREALATLAGVPLEEDEASLKALGGVLRPAEPADAGAEPGAGPLAEGARRPWRTGPARRRGSG